MVRVPGEFLSGHTTPAVNHLPTAGQQARKLPRHAHIVVHERDGSNGLVTVYDCGAAQKPPSAQLVGTLGRVEADHRRRPQATGYTLTLREPARLEGQPRNRWVVRA